MRILVVTPTFPRPTSGGRTRLFNLVRQLASRHEVSLLSFFRTDDRGHLEALQPYCERLELVPLDVFQPLGTWRNRVQGWSQILFSRRPAYVRTFPVERLRPALRGLLQQSTFDVVVFEQLFLVELFPETRRTPALLVEQNVESEVARRTLGCAANPIHRLRDWLVWRRLAAFEQGWVRRFAVCVAVSEPDAGLLRQMSPATEVIVVPNGVDAAWFAPPPRLREPERLLFFGTLSYGPNIDGVRWFCERVLPEIRRENPNVVLEIAGPDAGPATQELSRLPGVTVSGFVPDIREVLWSATLSVVPLRIGGGTRLKVLESLAAGCPVVSTSLGVEGLDLLPDDHFLVADTAEQWIESVRRLLGDGRLRSRLGEAGCRVAREQYGWGPIAARLEAACARAAQRHGDLGRSVAGRAGR